MSTRSRVRTSAIAATAVAASAALVAGATLGPTAVQSAQSERTVVADPSLAASTSIGGGIAVDPEEIAGILWPSIGWLFGESTAIAVLPGAAIAAAASGESATAFSLLGLSIATTDIPGLGLFPGIPTGQTACIGVLAFANSSTDGACINVLGTFDADYNKDAGEVSVALTNPLALLSLLTGDIDADDLIDDIIDGKPISRILTDDFVRLTLGGPGFVKLTSDYAFQEYKNSGGGVVIGWLGGQMVLFPVVTGGGVKDSVNYIGLPQFNLTGFPSLDGIGNIIPSLSFGKFETPIPGVSIPAWSTGDFLGSTNTSTSQLAAFSEPESAPAAKLSAVVVPEAATSGTPETAPVESAPKRAVVDPDPAEPAPVAPAPQPAPEVESNVAPEPADPPAEIESTPEVESAPAVEAPSPSDSGADSSGSEASDDAA